jgi:predicted permease
MSLWSRIGNVFRGERLSREIDEELRLHVEEAIAQGRDPEEARRALGSALRLREESRDVRLIAWLDSLRADAVFGWRQLVKRKVTSAAATLSLALAIGASTSAFRLIDALLLRPLPVDRPEQLYFLSRRWGIGPEGKPQTSDEWAYPAFRQMGAAVRGQAELLAIGPAERTDLSYGSDEEMEKGYVQCVSGRMFGSFGLRPALGRLLTEEDDLRPGGHPYAVLSYDYWTRRFARDPKVVGRTLRMDDHLYEIVGVAQGPFTGTETGTVTDIFLPTMMHPFVNRSDATWLRTFVRLKAGVAVEPVRQKLEATSRAFEQERAKGFTDETPQSIQNFLNQTLLMRSAAAGASGMQRNFRLALVALGALVALVLFIACTNVANLMTAQAAARAREMAVRVSIGAGGRRLVQLILVESALLAFLAAATGVAFAWWSAPLVVSMINPPDNPAQLFLPADWRVLAFGGALTLGVTFLFGLSPALRASAVTPMSALKGGEDLHARRRLMHSLIAVQSAFCFLVLFGTGMFVATFDRLANQPTGFSTDRLLVLDTIAARAQQPVFWNQVAENLRTVPGVEAVALADWALLNGNSRNNVISIGGAPPTEVLAYFRYISPGWIEAMKISLVGGRDFRAADTSPGAAIVNEAFARAFFNGGNPVGKSFERLGPDRRMRYEIVGLVRDIRYRNMRDPILPVAFVPLRAVDASGASTAISEGTFIVRTSSQNPLALASTLRREVRRARPESRVTNIHAQLEIKQAHTVRERLLAKLALFFAVVAILLAALGLYGVLHYTVLQRRREIGIRMAVGARAVHIAELVSVEVFSMVLAGALAGLALGFTSVRYIESLLYQVKPTDPRMLAFPALTILVAALLTALAPVIRAVRIDPATTLRSE